MASLEEQAVKSICTCYHWQLFEQLDELSVAELKNIIRNPFYGHMMNDEPVEVCEDYKGGNDE